MVARQERATGTAPAARLRRVVVTEQPLTAETPVAALQEPLTPTSAVFIRNHFRPPEVNRDDWRIDVVGGTAGPHSVALETLRQSPAVSIEAVLECAGNGRSRFEPTTDGTPWGRGAASCVRWTGLPLRQVLESAGVPAGAIEVYFEGADGAPTAARYARSLPIAKALDPDVLLAWSMNDRPLPRGFGGPLRLIVPGWYGMASVKWLTRMRFLERPFAGFFQLGEYVFWPPLGDGRPVREIKVRSLIVAPEDGAAVGSKLEIWGRAWSGPVPVARVELEIDGSRLDARLEPAGSRWAWRRWGLNLRLPPGAHRVTAWATDESGETQPARAEWNSAGYENNSAQAIEIQVTG